MDIYICISIDQPCFWQPWAGEAVLKNVGIKGYLPNMESWMSKQRVAGIVLYVFSLYTHATIIYTHNDVFDLLALEIVQ